VRWSDRRELFGIDIPEPLFQWQVWKTNIFITLVALAIGLVVWLILRRMLRGPQSFGYRFWRAMGHPISIVMALILVLGPLFSANALRRDATGRPNIILISLDALRVDHLGCYGYSRDTSPEMDRLAESGVRFDWAICQAPTTLPSHMSTLTSFYPTVHGVKMGRRLAGWRLTLAEYLRENGYRTAGCTGGGYMRASYGFGQGFELYDDAYKSSKRSLPKIMHWLDTGLADGPFFLLFHTYDIHSPYNSPEPWKEMFTDPDYDGDFQPSSSELERVRKQVESNPARGHGLSQEDIDFIVSRYDAGIRWVDHWIGRLVRGLDERGLLESTWIVITADHGEEFTEHGAFLHGKLYLTCAHVPLIISGPGAERERRTIPEIVELIDLMPTFLDLAGIAPVDTLQGRSLLPLINGVETDWDNLAFSEHHTKGGRRSVVSPALHILTSLEHGEVEVYDYRADPMEQSQLDDPSRAGEVRDLFTLLQEWSRTQILLSERQGGTERAEIDLETIEQLRALGYID
jgi:arylsulfatase A-like enzyme